MKSKPSLLLFLMIGFLVFGIAGADDRSKLVEKMTKTLTKSKKAEEREDAAKTLGTLKAVEAVGVLAGALKDPDSDVRWEAAYALYEIAPQATGAIPALKEALQDSYGMVRLNAVAALRKMDVPKDQLIPSMRELLKDHSATMRVKAAGSLLSMEVSAAEVLPVILDGLKDPDPDTRKEAAEILDDAGELPKDALPALMDAAKNANPVVRETVMKAIGKMGLTAEKAVPTLTAALKDVSAPVRKNAVDALAAIGPGAKSAIPAIVQIAGADSDAYARRLAIGALAKIDVDNPAALPAFLKALKDQDKDVRSEALDALRDVRPLPATAAAAIKEVASSDPDEIVRLHASHMADDVKSDKSATVKLQVTPRPQIEPLLAQLNKELKDTRESFKTTDEAKQYLHDRDIQFTKDEFWSNLTQGYTDVTEAFLKMGMSPNTSGGSEANPLQFSAMSCNSPGEAQIALTLLAYGADPNVTDSINRTPILSAVETCPVIVVKALLMSGARTDIITNGGATVLSTAVMSGDEDVVRLLLNSGYKIKKEPSYLLQTAKKYPAILQMLQKAGVK